VNCFVRDQNEIGIDSYIGERGPPMENLPGSS